jgi:anti-sigma factor RsiW
MHEEWVEKLSDYLDGELSAAEREAVESHLARCAACTRVLEDLRRVVAKAASIQSRPPAADLWAGIAERIDASTSGAGVVPFRPAESRWRRIASGRVSFSLPQLAAAAVLLIALSGGLVWLAARSTGGATAGLPSLRGDGNANARVSPGRANLQPRGDTGSADLQGVPDGTGVQDRGNDVQAANISFADQQYDAAVADLEKAVTRGRGRLDASTIAIVEHNLQIIDQAITQARQALAADPANSYLSGHLVEARRRKLDLLRRAAALSGESD